MSPVEQYIRAENCYIGEVDGYGYAFVPGSVAGVVILDLRSKEVLSNLSLFQEDRDEERIQLFLKNGLIRPRSVSVPKRILDTGRVRSVGVWLHVSNTCNFDCPGCYIAKRGRGKMSIGVARDFLDNLGATIARHELTNIGMRLAGGEPTTNKEIVYFIVNEAKERFLSKGIKAKLAVITNGTLLTREFLDFVVKNKLGLSISLDGTKEWNDKTRFFKNHRGSFDEIYRGIRLCREFGLKPNILSTITEDNLDGLPDLGKFLVELNLPFRFGPYRDNSGGYSGYGEFTDRMMSVLNDFYDYYAEAIRSGKTTMMHRLSDIHFDKKPHLRGCNVGYSGVTVSHRGKVFLCQAAMDRKPIGNIWNGRTLLEMAWSQKTLPELSGASALSYPSCSSCQWLFVCGGGCPLVNANANGLATTRSPYCELFQSAIPRLVELKALSNIQKLKLVSWEGGKYGYRARSL